jgi:hypothetical protein
MAVVRLFLREAEGPLPNVCMVCGREATLVKRKSFSWNPSWVWVTLLLGLLPFLIIALILTKRATVEAPLCAEHKYHWAKRTALVLLGLLVVIGVLIVAITLTSQPANVGRRFVWVWFVWLASPPFALPSSPTGISLWRAWRRPSSMQSSMPRKCVMSDARAPARLEYGWWKKHGLSKIPCRRMNSAFKTRPHGLCRPMKVSAKFDDTGGTSL